MTINRVLDFHMRNGRMTACLYYADAKFTNEHFGIVYNQERESLTPLADATVRRIPFQQEDW